MTSEPGSRLGQPFVTAALVLSFAAVPVSCSAQVRESPLPSIQVVDIPTFPADTTPADVWRNPAPGGVIARDLIWVGFKRGTSTEQKREAITAISGVVIGGIHVPIGEGGMYLIRIPDPGEDYLEVLVAGKSRLEAFSFVEIAILYIATEPAAKH